MCAPTSTRRVRPPSPRFKAPTSVDAAPNMNDDHMYYYPAGALADKFIQNGSCFVYSFEYPVSGEKFSWNATVVTPKHAEELVSF